MARGHTQARESKQMKGVEPFKSSVAASPHDSSAAAKNATLARSSGRKRKAEAADIALAAALQPPPSGDTAAEAAISADISEKEDNRPNSGKRSKKADEHQSKCLISPAAPTAEFAAKYGENPSARGIPREIFSLASAHKMLEYSLRPEGQVRIVSWNVSSFNSCEKKGLFKYLEVEQPDIVVLTETKVNEAPDMHPGLSAYPHRYWGIDAKTKGYAGVAVFSKIKPLKATIGMPLHPKEYNGRIITLEFSKHFLVGTYVTNAGEGLAKMSNKQQWNAAFAEYIKELDAQKPVIWCGDLNVMLDQRDLSAPKKKWNKQPGYSKIECDAHRVLLEGKDRGEGRKLVDVWRVSHPDAVGHFTFYSFRGACRGKGIGWRLDSFIISERALGSDKSRAFVQQCEIRHEVYGPSDHVPVICDVLGPL